MKYTIKFKSIIIFLSLFCSFIPMSFYYIPMSSLIIWTLRVLRFALLAYYAIEGIKRGCISRQLSKMLMFLAALLLSTLVYGGGIVNYLENASAILLVFLMVGKYVYCGCESERYSALKSMYNYFLTMMSLNAVSMLLLPQGVYRVVFEKDFWHELSYPVYFLNSENRLIEFMLPLLVLSAIMYEKRLIRKYSFVLSITLITFTMFKAMSLTSITGILVAAIIYIVIRKKNITSKVVIAYPLVFSLQLVFEVLMTSTGILVLLNFLFGRVDTIQSRYLLSQQAIKVVSQNYILGVGTAESGRLFMEGSMVYWAHNHALDTLVQSGINGFAILLYNLIKDGISKKYSLNNVQKIIFAGMMGVLVMGMTESFFYSVEFYLILSLTDI